MGTLSLFCKARGAGAAGRWCEEGWATEAGERTPHPPHPPTHSPEAEDVSSLRQHPVPQHLRRLMRDLQGQVGDRGGSGILGRPGKWPSASGFPSPHTCSAC